MVDQYVNVVFVMKIFLFCNGSDLHANRGGCACLHMGVNGPFFFFKIFLHDFCHEY